MASKTIVSYVDDLDGVSEAARTVSFSLDGSSYEIDLSEENFDELFAAMNKYVQAARKVGRTASTVGGGGRRRSSGTDKAKLGEVRAWAKSVGLDVNDRGRIPASIMEKFDNRELVSV